MAVVVGMASSAFSVFAQNETYEPRYDIPALIPTRHLPNKTYLLQAY